MSRLIRGNTKSLTPSELRNVERLYSRRLNKDQIVSLEFAREVFRTATSIKRRIGVLVSREGRIEEVFIGSREILYLPDLGRYRLGAGRLRRLRLIFSDLSTTHDQAFIPSDIYTDLQKLRLDAVVAVKEGNGLTQAAYSYLLPPALEPDILTKTEVVSDLSRLDFEFSDFIDGLESELSQLVDASKISGPNGAVLIGVYDKSNSLAEASMVELEALAKTAGVTVADKVVQRRTPDPKTLLGKGKLEQVILRCLGLGVEMIIFDAELKPGQWRVITNLTDLKVLDRSMLILDIFAQRAQSSEGRLQVELAQLKYTLPRLVEMDSGLSRLSGGIGGRGPGETKLEIGRRRIRDRLTDLERKIDKLSDQRGLRRQRRQDSGLPLVSILGYTNAGKSTLFNALTQSNVLAENKLFATLDPAQRKVSLPTIEDPSALVSFVLSDTVGFIRSLPEELKNAFRATLEELSYAQLLLHVVDASDPDLFEKMSAVEAILNEMSLVKVKVILVANKVDRASSEILDRLSTEFRAILVSSTQRKGFAELRAKIISELLQLRELKKPPSQEVSSPTQ